MAYFGGSFAPPLSDELLDSYADLIGDLDHASQLHDILTKLFACACKWWEMPDSKGTEVRNHPSGVGVIVPLEDKYKADLFDLIPWKEELEVYQRKLDEIDPVSQKDLRNAAFHLLWHVKELEMDREPLTAEKITRS